MARGPNRAPGVVKWGEVGLRTADGGGPKAWRSCGEEIR
jgi:hypothetical protein